MHDWASTVERIGARFSDGDEAVAAMRELRQRFGLDAADIEVRALGTTRYDAGAPRATLLAGRFPADDAGEVVGLIEARGGQIVERRSEAGPASG